LISTSTTLFHYLKCHSFEKPEVDGGGEDSFLYLDYSLDCYGERYAEYLPFCLGNCLHKRGRIKDLLTLFKFSIVLHQVVVVFIKAFLLLVIYFYSIWKS